MERTRSGSPERTSSVREAINLFGEKMVSNGGKQNKLKPHFSLSDVCIIYCKLILMSSFLTKLHVLHI